MRSRIPNSPLLIGALLAAACVCGPVLAGDGAAAPVARTAAPLGSVPLDAEALEALRGGEASVDTSVLDQGQVDGNSADGIVSGLNSIDGGAFGNAAGISTVIQNSGSNVLIQNGTAVNVQFVDPTP